MNSTLPPNIRTYGQLAKTLQDRRAAKSASVAPVPAAPEKDPHDTGTVAIPVDPQSKPSVQNLPAQGTNTDITPSTTLTPAKKIDGPEKAAGLGQKAANVVASVNALKGLLTKSATAAEITPTLPSDKANDNKNTTPTAGAAQHPHNSGTPDPVVPKAAAPAEPAAVDPTKKDAPTPPADSKGPLPADAKNTDDGKAKEKEKMASDTNFAELAQLDPAFAIKIASAILATEDGRAIAQRELEKSAGAEQAEDIIKAAMFMEKQAALLLDEEEAGIKAANEYWANATPEERAQLEKVASVHVAATQGMEDFEKIAYDQGAGAAAQMQDAGQMGQDPGQAGQISMEDIMQVLQQLVQSGEVQPQEAQEIMQALAGGGGGAGGAPGGDPSGGMPPGGDPSAGGGMPPGMGGGAAGGPEGAGAPAGDGSGGPPKGAAKKAPKEDEGEDKEAAAIVKQSSALAASLVEEALKELTATK